MAHRFVHNILCVSCDESWCAVIANTLNRIKTKAPSDYERLIPLVLAIVSCEQQDGTMGEWLPLHRVLQYNWSYGIASDTPPGMLFLNRDLPLKVIPGVVAHEFGHAVTRYEDLARRGPVCEEWRSELTADWYAYRWGFGREIATRRKSRDSLHHGPGPGGTFEEYINGEVYHYRVSRSFVAHLIEVE